MLTKYVRLLWQKLVSNFCVIVVVVVSIIVISGL